MTTPKKTATAKKKTAGRKTRKNNAGSQKLTIASRPDKLTIRSYQVGFGDCFLLTFHYGRQRRHVLIDFGSTGRPKDAPGDLLMRVANQIKEHCEGKLHIVVATHRHQDHISGFKTSDDPAKKSTGEIISECRPDVVIMPWTEDPDAAPDARHATEVKGLGLVPFARTLNDMQMVAASIAREEKHLRFGLDADLSGHLAFLGEDNLKNHSAVKNLLEMGQKGRALFVRYEDDPLDLDDVLPGVTVRSLGPPDLTQSDEITSMRSKDAAQFWMLQAASGRSALHEESPDNDNFLFHSAAALGNVVPVAQHLTPPHTRWFIRRMNSVRGTQLLELVRVLDSVLNNTSIILLFEAGRRKLLFPGDAQIENWNYALSKPEVVEMLADVDVYKVGHHGSRNANPISIWEGFKKKKNNKLRGGQQVMQTFMSTMSGKHGGHNAKDPNTEVPRESLVEALKKESEHFSTQMLGPDDLFKEFEIKL